MSQVLVAGAGQGNEAGEAGGENPWHKVRIAGMSLAWVAITDGAIYRGGGWSGVALVLAFAPFLAFALMKTPRVHWRALSATGVCWLGLLAKLVWCGSADAAIVGGGVCLGLIWALHGVVPYVGRVLSGPFRICAGAVLACIEFLARRSSGETKEGSGSPLRLDGLAGVLVPLAATLVFSLIFVMANPDLRTQVAEAWSWSFDRLLEAIQNLDWFQVIFWCGSAFLGLGISFPYLRDIAERNVDQEIDERPIVPMALDVRYLMARNTLWMVIVLFAAYLVYEVSSMWFRSFPKGFYYAGYAHQGAFWLTVALALSTIILSMIFCRSMLRDARLKNLRKLAWIWSFENWVLAIAAFYRLAIYIDFNGMTRMRVIGILGVGTVVMGFGLVVYKIIYTRSFAWLIQRQLWALAAAFVLHAILPVDWLVHAHNGREVRRGHWSPSVQTIVHPMRPDGMLPLISLVDCDDVEIREGVRAMAADWRERLARNRNWTEFQLAEKLLMSELDGIESKLAAYRDRGLREARLKRFREYAYQWY